MQNHFWETEASGSCETSLKFHKVINEVILWSKKILLSQALDCLASHQDTNFSWG